MRPRAARPAARFPGAFGGKQDPAPRKFTCCLEEEPDLPVVKGPSAFVAGEPGRLSARPARGLAA